MFNYSILKCFNKKNAKLWDIFYPNKIKMYQVIWKYLEDFNKYLLNKSIWMNESATIWLTCLAWKFVPLIENFHMFTNRKLLEDITGLF